MRQIIFLTCVILSGLLSTPAFSLTLEQWVENNGINTDVSYDATRVMGTEGGELRFKEHKAPGKSLIEMNMGGMQGSAIIRDDLQKAWFVMPNMGMYREMNLHDASRQQADSMQVSKVEKVGRETINGYPSTKFETKFKNESGKGTGFMWITDSGVPIKMDMTYENRRMKGQRLQMHLEDLVIRPQDNNLFELPAGLQKMGFTAIMGMAKQMSKDTAQDTQPVSQQRSNVVEEVGKAAADETQQEVKNETRRAIRDGIRSLFRK